MTDPARGCRCPQCGSDETRPFFRLNGAPVFCNVLHASSEEARGAAVADIHLHHCPSCGMIFNARFEPQLVRYANGYENSLYCSGRFRAYADRLVQELAECCVPAGGTVVEIGCGDGRFTRALCAAAGARGIGYDPSAPADVPDDEHVRIHRSLFDPRLFEGPVSLIVCRHVLEHIDRPLEFVRSLGATARSRGAHLFLEVPCARWTLESGGVWDIIYEHCSYFTSRSLTALVARAGFDITDVQRRYNGQFLTLHAIAGAARDGGGGAALELETGDEEALVERFARDFSDRRESWKEWLRQRGGSTVVWGTGSKGVSFLCAVDPDGAHLQAAVDLNPRKHGRHVPVTGHRVISPEELPALKPRTILVMNPVYLDEVRSAVAALGLGAEVLAI